MVDSKQLTLQQALGFDIEYSAQVYAQERQRLAAILRKRQTAISQHDRRRH